MYNLIISCYIFIRFTSLRILWHVLPDSVHLSPPPGRKRNMHAPCRHLKLNKRAKLNRLSFKNVFFSRFAQWLRFDSWFLNAALNPPIKKMMWLSLFLSYTASILFVSGGRPIQKFFILAGLRDTRDPSRFVLQKCSPVFQEREYWTIHLVDVFCMNHVSEHILPSLNLGFKFSSDFTKYGHPTHTVGQKQDFGVFSVAAWFLKPTRKTQEVPLRIGVNATFKKEDLSSDICHGVKASLTALLEWGIRAVVKKGKEVKGSECCLNGRRGCRCWTHCFVGLAGGGLGRRGRFGSTPSGRPPSFTPLRK